MRLRVGTRRSRLARTQAEQVCRLLSEKAESGLRCEQVAVATSGDREGDRPLREIGGKGLFTKELDEALLAGRIDCAVHSLKDVPSELASGLVLAAVPAREDPRDMLLSTAGWGLAELPAGTVVGTTSLRRSAQLLARYSPGSRPRVKLLRGNVETRLARLGSGEFGATFLAAAGIARLGIGLGKVRSVVLDPFDFVPAPGQGALAVVARADDARLRRLLERLDDQQSRVAVEAERAVARRLGGSCRLPLGAYAARAAGDLRLLALVASPDGNKVLRQELCGEPARAEALGVALGERLLEEGAGPIIAQASEELLR